MYPLSLERQNESIILALPFHNCDKRQTDYVYRTSHPEVLLVKGVLKICSKFTGEHPCRSGISIKLQSNFIEITIGHGCSAVNLLYILRTPFTKSTSEGLLLRLP